MDAELVAKAQRREKAAFEKLATEYRTRVLSIVRAQGCGEDAEDVVQNVFLRAWEKLPALRDPQAFAAWLTTLTRNTCRDWYRRAGRNPLSLDEDAPAAVSAVPNPLDSLIRWEESLVLHEALNAIPHENRRVLIMHIWGRYAYAEISKKLGLSISAVASRIRRAKLQLRTLLSAGPESLPDQVSITGGRATMPAASERSGGRRRPILVPQIGHTGQIGTIAISPDGQRFASKDNAGTLILWDLETGRQELRLSDCGWEKSIRFSPDGNRIAFMGHDQKPVVYDVQHGVRLMSLRAEGVPLAFTPDGDRLWTAWWTPDPDNNDWHQTNLFCWDLATKRIIRRVENLTGKTMLLTPDQNRFITLAGKPIWESGSWVGMEEPALVVWDLETREEVVRLRGLEGVVTKCSCSPDGRWVTSSPWGSRMPHDVLVWDVESGELVHRLRGHEESVGAIEFTPDGSSLVTADLGGAIISWDIRTGREQRRILSGGRIDTLAFTPDGLTLLSPATPSIPGIYHPRSIRIWDWRSGRAVRDLGGHGCWIATGEFSPDQSTFAAGGFVSRILRWDCRTGALASKLPLPNGAFTLAISHSPSGDRLVSASPRYQGGFAEKPLTQLALWDLTQCEAVFARNEAGVIGGVAYSPDGACVAACRDDEIVLLDTTSGQIVRSFRHREGWSTGHSVSFTPDGAALVSVGWRLSETCRIQLAEAVIWDLETGEVLNRWESHRGYTCLCFSPDGTWLALGMSPPPVGRDGFFQIRLYQVRTGELREFTVPQPALRVVRMRFSPDGTILAASDASGTIFLWNAESGQLLKSLGRRASSLLALDFSPDGRLLAAGGYDGAIAVWKIADILKKRNPRETVALIALDGGAEWLAYTPEGFYECSPGAEKYLLWRKGSEYLGADAMRRRFHRPETIQRALSS